MGEKYPADTRKRKMFAKAINKYANRTPRELKNLLVNIQDRAVVEVMAIRALVRAAEDGTVQMLNLILNTSPVLKAPKVIDKRIAAAPEEPDLPDPGEVPFDEAD